MAKNLVNGTNVVIEENGDNISMNLSSAYNTNLQQEINDSFKENNIYSTTETVVGTRMGKPLYRKVIVLEGGTIHAGYYEYNHNISNLSQVLNIYGMCYSSTKQHPIQRVVPDAISNWGIGLGDITQSKFALHFGNSYQDINLVYIVIEYTKTTD